MVIPLKPHTIAILGVFMFFALGERKANIHCSLDGPALQVAGRNYIKTYYPTKSIKTEGWEEDGLKTGYWYYYHPNGKVSAKGHYTKGSRNGYWFFYAEDGSLNREGHFKNDKKMQWWIVQNEDHTVSKMQYGNGVKNGYCLIYKNGKLIRAERFKNDMMEGSWISVKAFKQDNPNAKF